MALLALLHWFGASTCRLSRRETLLPCSVGRADVRITEARIYSEAEKEAEQKASAITKEMALAVGSWRLLLHCIVFLCIAYCRLKPNCSIELLQVQVSYTTKVLSGN
ncbi:MAG: hypothetical protein H0U39_08880 [Segetibacter sp.]|nr:hypothetical protein [Segetibacter sp.]